MDLQRFIISGRGKLRYQDFTSSGTFTPSAELLAKGGQCFVILIGGGGAGGSHAGVWSGNPGDAGELKQELVTVSAPVTVTIGAGGLGAAYIQGNSGSNSTFGALLTALGGRAAVGYNSVAVYPHTIRGGMGALSAGSFHPDEGFSGLSLDARGGVGWSGRAGGGGGWAQGAGALTSQLAHSIANSGGGSAIYTSQTRAPDGTPNTGGGGAGTAENRQTTGGNGGSGWCRVIWFE